MFFKFCVNNGVLHQVCHSAGVKSVLQGAMTVGIELRHDPLPIEVAPREGANRVNAEMMIEELRARSKRKIGAYPFRWLRSRRYSGSRAAQRSKKMSRRQFALR
ncbi:MAG TPA: hypothetical protein VIG36_14825, partial [Methylocystis sp.]